MPVEKQQIVVFLIVTAVLMTLLVTFIVTMLYLYSKRQRRHQRQLAMIQNDFDKNILNVQLEMQEQTLQHIGREIHDTIGLNLTLAKLRLNTLPTTLPPETTEKIYAATALIGTAIDDLKALSHSLNTGFIEANGLLYALEEELKKVAQAGSYGTHFTVSGEAVFLPTQHEILLFRIVQEALQNIVKHAGAKHIQLRLYYTPHQLHIDIEDDGKGPHGKGPHGQGLKTMQQRAANCKGTCTLTRTPAGGSVVQVVVPI